MIRFLFILASLILLACNNRTALHLSGYKTHEEDNSELTLQLEKAKETIVSVRDKIESMVKDKDDHEMPYEILVTQKEASKIKAEAAEILESHSENRKYIRPLEEILTSCENQDSKWDEYCFKNMPWFGVEPILNVWISKYEEALNALVE